MTDKTASEALEELKAVHQKERDGQGTVFLEGRISASGYETIRQALQLSETFNPEIHEQCEGCRCDNKVSIAINFTDDDVGFCEPCWQIFWRDTEIERLKEQLAALQQDSLSELLNAISDLAQFIELSEYQDSDGVPLLLKHNDAINKAYGYVNSQADTSNLRAALEQGGDNGS